MVAKDSANVVINPPVKEIFAFAFNPENEARWISGLIESRLTSEGPMGVSSTAG